MCRAKFMNAHVKWPCRLTSHINSGKSSCPLSLSLLASLCGTLISWFRHSTRPLQNTYHYLKLFFFFTVLGHIFLVSLAVSEIKLFDLHLPVHYF